jgi:hypothetical protein
VALAAAVTIVGEGARVQDASSLIGRPDRTAYVLSPGWEHPVHSTSLGVISVGATASGEAVRLLSGTYTLRPPQAGAQTRLGPVIVGPAGLLNCHVLRRLRQAYEAGATVAVTRAGPAAARLLGRALGSPELGVPFAGPRRADLVAFRQVHQDGRSVFNVSVLMPRDRSTATPTARKEGNLAADRLDRDFLVRAFSAPPVLPAAPTSGEPPIDLLKVADAYQTSLVKDDSEGHAVQLVNTVFSARSFTNRKDVYLVQQEIAVQGPASSPAAATTSINALLVPIKAPLTLQPSPQSTQEVTTITSEVSTTIGGSIGYTQGQGFNASINAGVTISNSKTITVPPVRITYTGDLASGDTSWRYEATGAEKFRTSTFFNKWLWQVPFDNYGPGATTVTIGSSAINHFFERGNFRGLVAYLDSIVPTPFGDLYKLGNPVVTGVSSATVRPGATFTIRGDALYPGLVEAVLIGGEPLTRDSFRPISDTKIEVVAPRTLGTAQPVVVKTSQGFSNADITITIKD